MDFLLIWINKYSKVIIGLIFLLVLFFTNGILLLINAYSLNIFIKVIANGLLLGSIVPIFLILRIFTRNKSEIKVSGTIQMLLFIWIFTICYLVFRLPFYLEHLHGEDGIFANLFLNQPLGPSYFFIGRINFKDIYIPIYHPALEYEGLKIYGILIKSFINFENLSDLELATGLRFIFSMIQYFIWIMIILMVYHISNKTNNNRIGITLYLIIIFLANSPTAIDNSVFLQIDGTYGIFAAGLVSIVFMGAMYNVWNRNTLLALLFVSFLLIGFGKTAWNIVLFLSALAMLPVIFLRNLKEGSDANTLLIPLLISITGLIAGNVINYWYDSFNYMGGLDLTADMARNCSFLKDILPIDIDKHQAIPMGEDPGFRFNVSNWLKLQKDRALAISTLYILVIFVIIYVLRNFNKANLYLIWADICGIGLFFCYFSGTWSSDGRYFSPAYISMSTLVMGIFIRSDLPVIKGKLLFAILIIVALYSIRHYTLKINLGKKFNKEYLLSKNEDRAYVAQFNNCIPLTGTFLFYVKEANFMTFMTTQKVIDSVAYSNNKKICK